MNRQGMPLRGKTREQRTAPCPICAGKARWRLALYDDRYGFPGMYGSYRCLNCGHRFLDRTLPTDILARIYTDYYPRANSDPKAHPPFKPRSGLLAWLAGAQASAFRWVPEKVRVLDVGCGFGRALGYHLARGCEAVGSEADENARASAEHYGYDIRIGEFNPDDYELETFDIITLDQVVEHLDHPLETLEGLERILAPGGAVILSTPNPEGLGNLVFNKRWTHWHAPYHIHLFSRDSMTAAAGRAGLGLESMHNVTSSEWLHDQWVHLFLKPKISQPSVFFSFKARGKTWQRALIRGLRLMHYTGVNHVLTRLFDMLGMGDNRVYVLRKPLRDTPLQ